MSNDRSDELLPEDCPNNSRQSILNPRCPLCGDWHFPPQEPDWDPQQYPELSGS